MTNPERTIEQLPISDITIINPRSRNKRVFGELVTSISELGLKKPITVSRKADGSGYNLVCGQGRLEAYRELGQTVIPAAVITASTEDCLIMSLVENLARRHHSPLELVKEIGALRSLGYSPSEIGQKTGYSAAYADAICTLLEKGEEKLLSGVERGIIPPSIAVEIARSKDGDIQDALTDAYERKLLPGNQIVAIRKIVDSRALLGKHVQRGHRQRASARPPVSADALVRAYMKETERQKTFIRNASLTQNRLAFLVSALRRLLDDEHFVTLLRAEQMVTVPKQIAELL